MAELDQAVNMVVERGVDSGGAMTGTSNTTTRQVWPSSDLLGGRVLNFEEDLVVPPLSLYTFVRHLFG